MSAKAKSFLIFTAFMVFAGSVYANSRIKVGSSDATYTPLNDPTQREPVSLSDYRFEINPEGTRVRLVVEYTYADQMTFSRTDARGGPQPVIVQLPKLSYNKGSREIIYHGSDKETVCATVSEKSGLFGHSWSIKNTGACTVSAVPTRHMVDDGWTNRPTELLDTYLEIH